MSQEQLEHQASAVEQELKLSMTSYDESNAISKKASQNLSQLQFQQQKTEATLSSSKQLSSQLNVTNSKADSKTKTSFITSQKIGQQKRMSTQLGTSNKAIAVSKANNAIEIGVKVPTTKAQKMISPLKSRGPKKDFVAKNMQVTTMRSIQRDFTEKNKERQESSATRKSLIYGGYGSGLLSPVRGLTNSASSGRLHEWTTINVNNSLSMRPSPSMANLKNQSKDFVVKHVEVTIEDLKQQGIATNNLGGTFCKTKKEKGYHLTNSSSVVGLNSYKSLDLQERGEYKEFPTTKGNQQLKRAMNKASVFPETSKYLGDEETPADFNCHSPRSPTVRNINNTQVQSMRLKNRSSIVF